MTQQLRIETSNCREDLTSAQGQLRRDAALQLRASGTGGAWRLQRLRYQRVSFVKGGEISEIVWEKMGNAKVYDA